MSITLSDLEAARDAARSAGLKAYRLHEAARSAREYVRVDSRGCTIDDTHQWLSEVQRFCEARDNGWGIVPKVAQALRATDGKSLPFGRFVWTSYHELAWEFSRAVFCQIRAAAHLDGSGDEISALMTESERRAPQHWIDQERLQRRWRECLEAVARIEPIDWPTVDAGILVEFAKASAGQSVNPCASARIPPEAPQRKPSKRRGKNTAERDQKIADEYRHGLDCGQWDSAADYLRQKHPQRVKRGQRTANAWFSSLLCRVKKREKLNESSGG